MSAGRMIFVDGQFNFAGADVMFSPGILIYAGVFLNRFAARVRDRPAAAGGGLGASFASVLQINADWAYARFADGTRAMRGDGTATLAGGELANFHMDFWSDGYISYSGRLGYSYPSFENPTFSIFGPDRLLGRGGARRRPRPLPGRRRPRDRWIAASGSRRSTASSTTTGPPAACSSDRPRDAQLPHARYDTLDARLRPATSATSTIEPTRSHDGHRAARGGRCPGRRATAGAALDRRAPASARWCSRSRARAARRRSRSTDPEGPHLHADRDAEQGRAGRRLRAARYLPGGNVTLLRVQHPRAGTWTLTPQLGSPAIDNVRSAQALPALHVTARVKGRGRSRVLTWNARGLGGRTIRFAERGQGRRPDDRVTGKQRGRARYAIEDGSAGAAEDRGAGHQRRRAGLDAGRRPLPAPGPPRPHRPGKLKACAAEGP